MAQLPGVSLTSRITSTWTRFDSFELQDN